MLTNELNDQSIVLSYVAHELKIRFVLTGDAGDNVFKKIGSQSLDEKKMPSEDFLTLLVLPHHGAASSQSTRMLNFFKPDILAISSGNGGLYSHPSLDLLEAYESYLEKTFTNEWAFWDKFKLEDACVYPAFKKGECLPKIHKISTEKLPIISTSISRTIKITKSGFYKDYKQYIELSDQTVYYLLFDHHLGEVSAENNFKDNDPLHKDIIRTKVQINKNNKVSSILDNVEMWDKSGEYFISHDKKFLLHFVDTPSKDKTYIYLAIRRHMDNQSRDSKRARSLPDQTYPSSNSKKLRFEKEPK